VLLAIAFTVALPPPFAFAVTVLLGAAFAVRFGAVAVVVGLAVAVLVTDGLVAVGSGV
jgi:hypothetical protein